MAFKREATCEYAFDPDDPSTWSVGPGPPSVTDPELSDPRSCKRMPHGDTDRCLFHLPPAERPDSADEAEHLRQYVRDVSDPGESIGGRVIDLVGTHLQACDLRPLEPVFEDHDLLVDLRHATVEGEVSAARLDAAPDLQLSGARIGELDLNDLRAPVGVTANRARVGQGGTSEGESSGRDEAPAQAVLLSSAALGSFRAQDTDFEGTIVATVDEIDVFDLADATVNGRLNLDGAVITTQLDLEDLTCDRGLSANGIESSQTTTLSDVTVERASLDGAVFGPDSPEDRNPGVTCSFKHLSCDEEFSIEAAAFRLRPNFEGCTFDTCNARDLLCPEGAHLDGVRVRSLDARNAEFDGETTFGNAVIEEAARFDHADFGGVATFDDARLAEATFERTMFRVGADFSRATLSNPVFDEASFGTGTNRASPPRTEFTRVTVDGDASFVDATLDGLVTFHALRAPRGRLVFDGATFGPEKPNNSAVRLFDFSELAVEAFSLRGGAVNGPVTFERFQTEGDVTFVDAAFESGRSDPAPAVFASVEIGGDAVFESARFEVPVTFRGATVAGLATFEQAVFDPATAGWDDRAPVDFATAHFEGMATFDNSRFTGATAFDEATFEEDARFRATPTGEGAPPPVFGDDLLLDGVVLEKGGDFRLLSSLEIQSTNLVERGAAKTVAGTLYARNADLGRSSLDRLSVGGRIVLTNADLSEAECREADLTGAEMEEANLAGANLFGTDLRDAELYGAILNDARIDTDTEFGRTVIYDPLRGEAENDGTLVGWVKSFYRQERIRNQDIGAGQESLARAISLYNELETLHRENGLRARARNYFVSRKRAREKQVWEGAASPTGGLLAKVRPHALRSQRLVMNYGESPWRVVVTSIVVVVVSSVLVFLGDLSQPPALAGSSDLLASFYFGLLVFTNLGVSGFSPSGLITAVGTLLADVLGLVMFGLLLFVLQRRTAR